LADDGYQVSISQLYRWFGVPRRTVYYRPRRSSPKVNSALAERIKALIEEEPSFGYRTVAGLLSMNKNTVQRIFQLKGWQGEKRAVGFRPRIEALPSVAKRPDERWSTDLCRVWGARDGWLSLALVMDCHIRELLGWQLSRTGKATTAGAALEQALIARFGALGRVSTPFLLRSDNELPELLSGPLITWANKNRITMLYIQPGKPTQNAYIERFNRTARHEWRDMHLFHSVAHAQLLATQWLWSYNNERPNTAIAGLPPRWLLKAA